MDLGTILLLFKSSLLVGAICFLYVRWQGDHNEGLGVLAASFGIQSVATTVAGMVQQGALNGAVWIIFNFSAGLAGYALLWVGLKQLTTCAPFRLNPIAWAPPVLLTALLALAGKVDDAAYRAIIFNNAAGIYLLASALMVISDLKRERLSAKIPLAISLALGAVLCAAIAVCINNAAVPEDYNETVFFLLILLFFIICLFIIIMVKERAEAELHRLLATDDLTGIPNRRHFFKGLPPELGDGDAIILLDIDHFKRVNDTFGHARGDSVLRDVATAISGSLPSNAIFGRLGGEEFGVFLPRAGADVAVDTAEAIRIRVQSATSESHSPGLPPTISAGVAVARQGGGISDTMSAADASLYKAKLTGRNRVHFHDSDRAGSTPS